MLTPFLQIPIRTSYRITLLLQPTVDLDVLTGADAILALARGTRPIKWPLEAEGDPRSSNSGDCSTTRLPSNDEAFQLLSPESRVRVEKHFLFLHITGFCTFTVAPPQESWHTRAFAMSYAQATGGFAGLGHLLELSKLLIRTQQTPAWRLLSGNTDRWHVGAHGRRLQGGHPQRNLCT